MRPLPLFLAIVTTLAAIAPVIAEEKKDGVWLLSYFRQRYEGRVEIDAQGNAHQVPLPNPMQVEKLHYALSTDGRNWKPLNANQPVWDEFVRDPFLLRGSDGLWHLLATGGRSVRGEKAGPVCLHAVSKDLITWEKPEALALMAGVKDDTGRPARNIWAPESFVDPATGDTILLWSSSFEDAGWKKSRLWYSRTRDWKTFSPPQVLFAPPYSVIDGTLLAHNGKFYLFHKEEEFAKDERRAIRVAIADRVEGPYEIVDGALNGGQLVPTITEGPSIMPDPTSPGWLLIYDYCMSDRFGVSSSSDLKTWKIEDAVSFPDAARHGCVTKLSAAEADRMRGKFPAKP